MKEGLPRSPAGLLDPPSMSPTTKDRLPTWLRVSLDDEEGLLDPHAVLLTDEAVLPMDLVVGSTRASMERTKPFRPLLLSEP
jgi:hypothetical protein